MGQNVRTLPDEVYGTKVNRWATFCDNFYHNVLQKT